MLFDNHRDACMRLVDTIVFYKGRAMWVSDITPRALKVKGSLILTGEDVSVYQQDDELSMHCPPVGYINIGGDAMYFMRQPMRRWKQGIDMRALVCPSRGMRARGLLNPKALAKCLENDYPRFEQTLDMFRPINPFKATERNAVAFSKHFSVRNGGQGSLLMYKDREVGVVEDGSPVLATENQWLAEALEAEL